MARLPRVFPVAIFVVAFLGTVSCSADEPAGDGAPTVAVTTSILGDLVANVAGDCAEIEVLMPPGSDPHEFELSAQQAASMRDADVVFTFGLGLEGSFDDALDAAAGDGVPVVAVSEEAPSINVTDPHIWQDPTLLIKVVPLIADHLIRDAGRVVGPVADRAADYIDDLGALDTQLAETYAAIPDERRNLVTNHDAFGLLADRYDFEVIGVVIPGGSTLAEPSSAELAALADVVDAAGVPAIFAETAHATDLAEALAAEVGEDVAVVELSSDSLGGPGSGAETYVELMRTNAERISEALG